MLTITCMIKNVHVSTQVSMHVSKHVTITNTLLNTTVILINTYTNYSLDVNIYIMIII